MPRRPSSSVSFPRSFKTTLPAKILIKPLISRSSGIEKNPTVFYKLIRGSTDQTNKYDTFYLQQRKVNGWTYADVKVNQPLDYERIKEYNLTIRVEVIKCVEINVSDCVASFTKS